MCPDLVKEGVLELQVDLCDDVSVKVEDEGSGLDWLQGWVFDKTEEKMCHFTIIPTRSKVE